MNKTSKIISVILAVVMALSVLPFAAFAAEEDADRVDSWKANYALLLEEVFDNAKFTSWNYVDQNRKAIDASDAALTAFALYDSAWINYFKNGSTADPENAKKALLALTEKASYEFNDGYVDEIAKIIDTAEDVNDMIQKVNKYLNIEVFESAGWSKTFEYIGYIGKAINAYQDARDKFVKAYAEILSVQMANMYYVDMLQYIVDQNSYAPLTQAASDLIEEIQAGVAEALQKVFEEIATETANDALNTLAKAAMDTNAYTAAALKIYQVGTSVVDVLWNTSELHPLFDTIRTAYYYQSDIAAWAKDAVNGEDAEKAIAAVSYALTAREFSEEALYKLKAAQDDGAIGKIQRKLYGTVYNDIEVNLAALDTMRNMFYNVEPADMKEVKRVLTIYCPVNMELLEGSKAIFTMTDGAESFVSNDKGVFRAIYSDFAKTYHKVAFLYDTYRVRLVGTGDGYVTLIMDALKDGAIEDWSFTDRKVAADTKIVFDTDYAGTPYYVASDANGTVAFNDTFVASAQPDVTVKDVVTATTEVGKEEAKSFIDKIMDFFKSLFEKIFGIFNKK
jgi:GTP1/Obg family GTP-binding protein